MSIGSRVSVVNEFIREDIMFDLHITGKGLSGQRVWYEQHRKTGGPRVGWDMVSSSLWRRMNVRREREVRSKKLGSDLGVGVGETWG